MRLLGILSKQFLANVFVTMKLCFLIVLRICFPCVAVWWAYCCAPVPGPSESSISHSHRCDWLWLFSSHWQCCWCCISVWPTTGEWTVVKEIMLSVRCSRLYCLRACMILVWYCILIVGGNVDTSKAFWSARVGHANIDLVRLIF